MQENQTNPVEIVVNGEPKAVPGGLTVAALLAHLGVDGGRVAVELNREIVRKPAWGETRVEAGANVEIVQFVGGGLG
jgi:sulfur carrier protein